MTTAPSWWRQPRHISVVVDNPSWVLPHAEALVAALNTAGDEAVLCRAHGDIEAGAVAFYLGCVTITPPEVLDRNCRNLVVHASNLPKGRGFSPLTWQIIEGCDEIPVCLLEAVAETAAGPIIYRDIMRLLGHELIGEMRAVLGELQSELCRRYLSESAPPIGTPQVGEATAYRRRRPEDSRLDPERAIAEQFDLLRTVDNEAYPAFFDLRGQRYKVIVEKMVSDGDSQ